MRNLKMMMDRPKTCLWLAAFGTLGLFARANDASAGIVTQIGLSDFDNAAVLDFQSLSDGVISGGDALFTDFGISSIIGDASPLIGGTDTYNTLADDASNQGGGANRGLFFREGFSTDNGLSLISFGDDGNNVPYNEGTSYSINLSELNSRIGFSILDQSGTFFINFFDGLTNVGMTSISFNEPQAATTVFYFENDMAFDRVILGQNNMLGGYGIDNITLESGSEVSESPAPGSALLCVLGVAGLACYRRYGARFQVN